MACRRRCIGVLMMTGVATAGFNSGCDSKDHAHSQPSGTAPKTVSSNPDEGSSSTPLLVDVTEEAGLKFVHDPVMRGGYLFPEITGSGCGFLDYDNDGRLDIYLVQSGRDLGNPDESAKGNVLYRNRGDGTFEDVTAISGSGDTGYGQGMATGDFNNDGYTDIYIQNVGPDVLLANNGDGTFADVTRAAGLGHNGWGIGCGFVDYDNDGWLDLYVANYVDWSAKTDIACFFDASGTRDYCNPKSYKASIDALYQNNRDGTFRDMTRAAGLHTAYGPGMSAICADFDDDGLTDIYVANDGTPNQLWHNNSDGTLTDVAMQLGCAVNCEGLTEASMGCNAEDFDGDGDLDLFMCSYFVETQTLFINEGRYFDDITYPSGLGKLTLNHTSFGACAFDLFNNGTQCLYIGNGAVCMARSKPLDPDKPLAERDMVLQWDQASRTFADISHLIGPTMNSLGVSRGVAVGDYDNDGDMDVLISNNNGPGRLLRNDAARGNHWFMVRCAGAEGARDAIGAKVLVTAGGRTRRRDVIVNYSYASSCDPRLHFGLGDADRVDRLKVIWPGGAEATWEHLPADQVFEARVPGHVREPD